MSLRSDERLAARARDGDERAFAAIFRRYHQALYRFCAGILSDPDDAQDALQNTMVKALRALPGEEREIRLKPWLYRIAHNESIDLMRRRRAGEEVDPEALAGGAGPEERAEARERLRRLLADLDELPERQRSALVMRELSGLGFEEIAAAFETSPAVARQTVYEARMSLRQIAEGREMSCDDVRRALSDGDRRVLRRKDIRAHLRSCASCERFGAEMAGRREDFAALAPLPAVAAAGILGGVLGGAGGTGAAGGAGAAAGGTTAGALGSGAAAGTFASSAAVKVAATVAVTAALGTAAADRSGLVEIGGGGGTQPVRATENGSPSGAGVGGGASARSGPGKTHRQRGHDRRRKGRRTPGRAAAGAPPASLAPGSGAPPASPPPADAAHGSPGSAAGGAPQGHGRGGGRAAGKGRASHGKPAHPTHQAKPPHPDHPAKPPPPPQATKPEKGGPAAGSNVQNREEGADAPDTQPLNPSK
jgi:RNA polymerase sigma factor (sigma-70 family)